MGSMSRDDYEINRPEEEFEVEDIPLRRSTSKSSLHSPSARGSRRKTKRLSSKQEARNLKIFSIILSLLFIVVVVVLLLTHSGAQQNRDASAAAHTGSTYETNFNMKQNWGAYSPYFDTGVPFEGISKSAQSHEYTIPSECKLKQVHVLHRHGDRFPAEGTADKMQKVAKKIKEMVAKSKQEGPLDWLNHWEYNLKEDLLVGAGVGALFESGSKFWGSHARLLYGKDAESLPYWSDSINKWPNGTQRPKPVLRATTQDRIESSAHAWAAGFFGTYGSPSTGIDPREHYDLVKFDESPGINNSLAGYFACPNADKPGAQTGKERSKHWVSIYLADAATRIQKMLPDFDNMTPEHALAIQDLCVFETAAFGSSAFCNWFTELEWRGFEYHVDLKFYGESAWGSEVAPATGLPWLTELRSRLKNQHIKNAINGVNVTLDSNEETFPLHQPFYADFTHDSVIVSVLSALQFPFTKHELPAHKIKTPRQFIISRLTPFAAKLYVEVMQCGDSSKSADYVRLKLNDRVLPIGDLKHCDDDDKEGFCELKNFVKSLDWALENIHFDDVCFNEHKYKEIHF